MGGSEEKFNRRALVIVYFILWIFLAFVIPSLGEMDCTGVLNTKTCTPIAGSSSENSSFAIDWNWVMISSIGFAIFGLIVAIIWHYSAPERFKYSNNVLQEVMEKYGIEDEKKFKKSFAYFDVDQNQYMKKSEMVLAAKSYIGMEDE